MDTSTTEMLNENTAAAATAGDVLLVIAIFLIIGVAMLWGVLGALALMERIDKRRSKAEKDKRATEEFREEMREMKKANEKFREEFKEEMRGVRSGSSIS